MNTLRADRNLLYGILALQLGFITRDALIAGMEAWVATRWKPLEHLLIEQRALSPGDHPLIEQVVRHLLEKHDDPRACLTVFDPELMAPLRDRLQLIGDPELSGSIANLDSRAKDDPEPDPDPDADGTTVWAGASPDGVNGSTRPTAPSGRFRILKPHARGGLGEVYLAWDEELGRHVALKEIQAEHSRSEPLRERFVREAAINANLEHPGIVPVYALGSHPDGRPYYAMRFVQGETLKDALERFHGEAARLDPARWAIGLRQLLRRFLVVCDSIDYAHSRGVLHRDLKPANILLGKFGETLIIDWGLAKIIGRDDANAPVGPAGPMAARDGHSSTLAGETMGSPPFMSPEQARGCHDELTPSSDLYSMGATLYAVLTGRMPVKGARTAEILEKVGRGEIIPLNRANPRVPRALEAICLKAMQFQPADRYPSARALADDLECWLDDRPVAIYKDHASTRLLRWSRQHKSLVAGSLVLLVATLAGLALFALLEGEQKRQAVVAQQQTEAARRRAKEHLGVGLDLVDQLVTFGDRQLITRMSTADRGRFLRAASNFIHQFREREPGDQTVQVQTAQVARRLANLQRLTGKFNQADPFYAEALLILGNLAEQSPNPRHRDLLAETLIDQGDAWITRGRAIQAEAAFQRALAIAREDAGASPGDPTYRRTLARSLSRLGSSHLVLGRADVVSLGEEAVSIVRPLAEVAWPTIKEKVVGGQILPLTDQLDLIQARYTLAEGWEQAGRPDRAEDQLRQALDLATRLADRFRGVPVADVDFFLSWVEIRLARLLAQGPKREESAGLLDAAVTRLDDLAKRTGDIPHFVAALADALAARAAAGEGSPSIARAKDDAEACQKALTPLLKDYREVPEYADLMAEVLAAQARMARREGADPTPFLEKAVRHQATAAGECRENPAYARRLAEYEALLKGAGATARIDGASAPRP